LMPWQLVTGFWISFGLDQYNQYNRLATPDWCVMRTNRLIPPIANWRLVIIKNAPPYRAGGLVLGCRFDFGWNVPNCVECCAGLTTLIHAHTFNAPLLFFFSFSFDSILPVSLPDSSNTQSIILLSLFPRVFWERSIRLFIYVYHIYTTL
jgi:hypothetical protein